MTRVDATIDDRPVGAVLIPSAPTRRKSVALSRYDRLAPGAAKPVRIHVLPDGWRWVDPAGSRCSVQVDAPPKGESAEAYGKSMHQAHADVLKAAAELDRANARAKGFGAARAAYARGDRYRSDAVDATLYGLGALTADEVRRRHDKRTFTEDAWKAAAARGGLSAALIDEIARSPMRPAPARKGKGDAGDAGPAYPDREWAPPPKPR